MEGVQVDSTGSTEVWLSWLAEGAAQHYSVEYGSAGSGTLVDIAGTTCHLQHLAPGILYGIYVRAYCPAARRPGLPCKVQVMLADEVICPTVERLRLLDKTLNMAVIAWDSLDGQLDYQISVGPYLNAPEDNHLATPYQNPHCAAGLDMGICYAARLRAKCHHQCLVHDSVVWSPWSEPILFYLGDRNPLGIAVPEPPAFTLTPNPARGTVAVAVEGTAYRPGQSVLHIADASGREVLCQTLAAPSQQLDLSALPAGIYFVTLATPQSSSTQRLVLE